MTDAQRQALRTTACTVCGHTLIRHHETTLRCQRTTKPHWWSRRTQCPCDMNLAKS